MEQLPKNIDLVITWVDGSNEEWRQAYLDHLTTAKLENRPEFFKKRYIPQNDLQVLLRSVERFAPDFFRKIWILHSPLHQPPRLRSDLIEFVTHDEVIPSRYLPTFSSQAIECFLHKIPGLAEHFIYFNDDVFFMAPVRKEHFFSKQKPLMFLTFFSKPTPKVNSLDDHWRYALTRTNGALNKKFLPHINDTTCVQRKVVAHRGKAFTREIFTRTWELFERDLHRLLQYRFRRAAVRASAALEPTNLLLPWVGLELELAEAGSLDTELMGCNQGSDDPSDFSRGNLHFSEPSKYELP